MTKIRDKIDLIRLHNLMSASQRAKASTLACFDEMRDAAERLKAARFRRDTLTEQRAQISMTRDAAAAEACEDRIAALDVEIAAAKKSAENRETEYQTAREDNAAVSRLAYAARQWCEANGVPVPVLDPAPARSVY